MLHRTPEFHHLLQSVADENVYHYTGTCGAHPEGWGWRDGAHMPPATEVDLDTLRHAGLVAFTSPACACGNKALLTFAGSERLSDWNTRTPVNTYSTGGAV